MSNIGVSRVLNIKSVGIKPVYDLHIQDDHSFIASDVPVHNSQTCQGLHGKKFYYDRSGRKPLPPAHYNCLLGDTHIRTCIGVSNIFKRVFKGSIINIRTEAGSTIKITPNHPILTRASGWKAAKFLNAGDEIASGIGIESFNAGDDNENEMITFAKFFSLFDILIDTARTSRPTAPEDFHSDVTDSEVDVINISSLITSAINSCIIKMSDNSEFKFSILTNILSDLASEGSLSKTTFALLATPSSLISFFNKCLALIEVAPIHSCLLLFGRVSDVNTILPEDCEDVRNTNFKINMVFDSCNPDTRLVNLYNLINLILSESPFTRINPFYSVFFTQPANSSLPDAKMLGDLSTRHTLDGIKFVKIISCDIDEFSGHVYNLENDLNWYLSNGIVTHNCRSTTLALYEDESRNENVQSFNEWLIENPTEARQALGDSRYRLVTDGRVRIERFTDLQGNRLTLEQLRKQNPQAYKRVLGDD